MPRAKGGYKTRRRRNKWLARAKGYQSVRKNVYKKMRETVERALQMAYRGRKQKKRDFRRLWIIRINAGVRQHGLSYSRFMGLMKQKGIAMDRKVLAEMAHQHPEAFAELVKQVSA